MLINKILKTGVKLLELLTVVLLIIPPIVVAISSLSPTAFSAFPPPSLSLRWFISFFSNPAILYGFQISIFFAIIVTAVTLAIGTLTSFVMARYKFKGKNLLDALIQAPIVFPGVALGNALLVYFYNFNYYYHPIMLILGQIIISLPYVFRALLPCFYGISQSFEEASLTLGANRVQTFFSITLPLVKPGLVAGAILGFAAAFNDYAVSVFLVDPTIQTLPVQLMGLMRTGVNPTIAAASTFTVLIMMGLLIVVEKLVGMDNLITSLKW